MSSIRRFALSSAVAISVGFLIACGDVTTSVAPAEILPPGVPSERPPACCDEYVGGVSGEATCYGSANFCDW